MQAEGGQHTEVVISTMPDSEPVTTSLGVCVVSIQPYTILFPT